MSKDDRERETRGLDLGDDGRNADLHLGRLEGEGSLVQVSKPGKAYPLHEAASTHVLSPTLDDEGLGDGDTYYGLPVLKQPVWKWYIPAYFYTGGLAGGASALGLMAQLVGGRRLRPLVRRTRWIAAVALVTSAGLLVADLGKPQRFVNMLRVVRPTSPMNVGTWILSASGGTAALAALATLASEASPALEMIGDGAGLVAGLLGPPLAGYTAVLLSNTAVPAWNGARRTLPFLFVASAATSAAAMLDLLPPEGKAAQRAARAFGIAGKLAELVSVALVERDLAAASSPRVVAPLRRGTSGALWKLASALTAASLMLSLAPGDSPRRRKARGLLGTLGALGVRFAIIQVGRASARDPRATFEPQRARVL